MSDVPPPPPPHGTAPRSSSGLPPGKYDIFVIPEHSAGSGFLYLPSLRPNVNSFFAGFASALILVALFQSMAPAFRAWWESFQGLGNMGMTLLIFGVGFGAWALGRTQKDGPSASAHYQSSYTSGGGGGGGGAGYAPGGFGSSTSGPSSPNGQAHGGPPPRPPPHAHSPPPPPPGGSGGPPPQSRPQSPPPPPPPPPRPASPPPPTSPSAAPQPPPPTSPPAPQPPPPTSPPSSQPPPASPPPAPQPAPPTPPPPAPQPPPASAPPPASPPPPPQPEKPTPPSQRPNPQPTMPKSPTPKGAWEKAREETRRKEEERKAKEAEQKRREEALRRLAELRAKEAKEREEREKEKERKEKEAREKKIREEAEKRRKELMERLRRERAEKAKEEEKKKEAEAAAAAAAAATTATPATTTTAAPTAPTREPAARVGSTYAFSSVGERTSMWPNGKPPSEATKPTTAAASPTKKPPSPDKRPPAATARSFVSATTESTFSYRPYDDAKTSQRRPSMSSFTGSDASWAQSHTTSRTSPPPSVRGPYTTKDPDKIVIQAVYLFMNEYAKTPASQLVSGVGSVTDGLILRITTEGLFIDDDVRGVPQREWDVKAWTLKLAEVWCPPHCLNSTASAAGNSFASGPMSAPHLLYKMATGRRSADRDGNKVLTGDEADSYLSEMLRACKECCRLGLCERTLKDSHMHASHGKTGAWKQKGLHLLRATIRDQEGKRYLFVMSEQESWKLAFGLQRLRGGTQVRQLGVAGMSLSEARGTLEMLGWGV
ncbi:hypothetical protein E4U53_007602 [Claviceps sorghi]|nr:hypothetical protein E4U53_007602 [Claviceps sorghi]